MIICGFFYDSNNDIKDENDDKFIITLTNSNNRVLNMYEMDKKTSVIKEISLGDSSSSSSN